MPRTLKLLIAYDGSRFAGWQRQKGRRSVQETLEETLRQILQEKVHVTGAGRTDAGVHAEGQAAHITVRNRMPAPVLHQALNALLPEDILIRSIRPAPRGFHARYSAKSKHYRYSIWNGSLRPLFDRDFLAHVREPLDVARMRRLARELQGRRDFRAFHSTGRPVRSTVRHLKRLTVTRKGPLIRIDAVADGFLYHMVRRIAGLLIEAGKGKPVHLTRTQCPIPVGRGATARQTGSAPGFVAPTAAAKGLCLLEVKY